MNDEYTENVMKGLRWIPIYKKAMEIIEELEKRNEFDSAYHNSLGDVLYYALVLFHDDIINHKGDVHDLIKGIREEYITDQENNLRFLRIFGKMECQTEEKTSELRQNKNKIEYEMSQLKAQINGDDWE